MENKQEGLGCSLFTFALSILFIALKLTGHLDWDWVWVTAPLWVPFTFILPAVLVIVIANIFAKEKQT